MTGCFRNISQTGHTDIPETRGASGHSFFFLIFVYHFPFLPPYSVSVRGRLHGLCRCATGLAAGGTEYLDRTVLTIVDDLNIFPVELTSYVSL